MAKQVNGPQNREQIKLMIDVVKREVNLAQDLLNSYQVDLIELEANSTMSDNEKASKRVFIETAIKESKELLDIRQAQLKSIDINRSGKSAGEARREVWNDTSLESKGMDAIIAEMSVGNKEQKHEEDVEKTRQERLARSEAVRNAAATLSAAAKKLAAEKNDETFETKLKPEKIPRPEDLYFDQDRQQWLQEEPDGEKFENTLWQIPTYDENGNLIFDEKGNMVFRQVSEEEYEDFLDNGRRTEAETAALAEIIKNRVIGQEDEAQSHNPQPQIHLNWFQKLKLWFMRLFNKNYQLPEGRNYGRIVSDFAKNQKEKVENGAKDLAEKVKSQGREVKRTIKGFSIPKVKQFFKDHKNKILALSAVAVASLALAMGMNGLKEHNKQIIEQKAAEAQKEADAEAKRAQEEQQALEEAAKKQEQDKLENEQDKLVAHNAKTLTSGTITKQYFAKGGLEYTVDSTGRGTKGTLAQDTIVEIFNRAIVKENEDGTKNILLTSNGKTWEDYAKDSGMSIDEIKNMLKQDKTYEMAAIQVGETNHNILNTYGWVKTSDLEESSKGTENLKGFEITTGDNTEILQQLQQNEKANQNQQEER